MTKLRIPYGPPDRLAHPPLDWPAYKSTALRAPTRPLVALPHFLGEVTGPVLGADRLGPLDDDLTRQHEGEPLGERIVVHGRVLDEDGRPGWRSAVDRYAGQSSGGWTLSTTVMAWTPNR